MSRTVSSPPATTTSATTTFAPSRAKICAVARPMPEPAPVIKATLPATRPAMGFLLFLIPPNDHGRYEVVGGMKKTGPLTFTRAETFLLTESLHTPNTKGRGTCTPEESRSYTPTPRLCEQV